MTTERLHVWFEFGSTYSYPAVARVEELARAKGVALALAAVSPRPDLPRSGLERLALQHLSGEGALHVARSRADLRQARARAPTPVAVSAERAPRRARRVCRRRRGMAARLHPRRLPRELRRGPRHRRSRGGRDDPASAAAARGGVARARANGGDEGSLAWQHRRRAASRHLRRADVRRARRALLGQRSSRGRARLVRRKAPLPGARHAPRPNRRSFADTAADAAGHLTRMRSRCGVPGRSRASTSPRRRTTRRR